MESAQWIAAIIWLNYYARCPTTISASKNPVALKTNGPAKFAGPSQKQRKENIRSIDSISLCLVQGCLLGSTAGLGLQLRSDISGASPGAYDTSRRISSTSPGDGLASHLGVALQCAGHSRGTSRCDSNSIGTTVSRTRLKTYVCGKSKGSGDPVSNLGFNINLGRRDFRQTRSDLRLSGVILVSRQCDGGQDGNDRNHDHQFDQRKTLLLLHGCPLELLSVRPRATPFGRRVACATCRVVQAGCMPSIRNPSKFPLE